MSDQTTTNHIEGNDRVPFGLFQSLVQSAFFRRISGQAVLQNTDQDAAQMPLQQPAFHEDARGKGMLKQSLVSKLVDIGLFSGLCAVAAIANLPRIMHHVSNQYWFAFGCGAVCGIGSLAALGTMLKSLYRWIFDL